MGDQNILIAYSNHDFGSHSSYPVLATHIANSDTIAVLRKEPRNVPSRIVNKLLRSFATTQWYRWTSAQLELQAIQKLTKHSYDVFHFLWADRDLGYLDLLRLGIKTPLVATFHCCPEELEEIFIFKNRLRSLRKVIVMSETQRAFFESCSIPAQDIHWIPHGIDTNFFKPSERDAKSDFFTALSVGSYKRDFTLLKQVARSLENYKYIKIKIVAPPRFQALFADMTNVEFVYGLTDKDLLKTYQSASCLILTVENATANNALLEGIACGLPVVAEKIGGIPEYLNPSCSILCESKQASLLAEAILQLSESSLLQEKMSVAAREKAMELSWSKVAKKTQEVYKSII